MHRKKARAENDEERENDKDVTNLYFHLIGVVVGTVFIYLCKSNV